MHEYNLEKNEGKKAVGKVRKHKAQLKAYLDFRMAPRRNSGAGWAGRSPEEMWAG